MNYDDIQRYNVLPVWAQSARTIEKFRFAPENSAEKNLWEYAIKKANLDEIFIRVDHTVLPELIMRMSQQSIALLIEIIPMRILGLYACKSMRDPESDFIQPEIHVLAVSDPRAIPYMYTSIMSSKIHPFYKAFHEKIMTAYVESGLQQACNQKASSTLVPWTYEIEECLSFTTPKKNSPIQPTLGLFNIIKLIKVFFIGLLVSSILLIWEKLMLTIIKREKRLKKKKQNRKKKKKTRKQRRLGKTPTTAIEVIDPSL